MSSHALIYRLAHAVRRRATHFALSWQLTRLSIVHGLKDRTTL